MFEIYGFSDFMAQKSPRQKSQDRNQEKNDGGLDGPGWIELHRNKLPDPGMDGVLYPYFRSFIG